MGRLVELSPAARPELRRAILWHTQPGAGPAVRRKLTRLLAAIDALRFAPCRWRLAEDGVRILVAGQHRAAYTVTPDTGDSESAGDVLVLRIFGPGQNF